MKGSFLPFSMGILLLILVGCAKEEQPRTEEKTEKVETMVMKVTDPVCGMSISRSGERTVEHKGETYYFCSSSCKDKFEDEPEKYIGK